MMIYYLIILTPFPSVPSSDSEQEMELNLVDYDSAMLLKL